MPAIVTQKQRIVAADYFQYMVSRVPTYIFIGGTSTWDNESLPPTIEDSTLDKISAYDEIVGGKKIIASNIASVIPRIDWESGVVYDEYTDNKDVINEKNPETNDFYKFYVISDEFNVYKCISNNDRVPSTVMPSGTSTSNFQTPDGYIWKYMYTIKTADVFDFMTPAWIPCYTLTSNNGSNQWSVQESAKPLTIDHIVVTDGGTGHTSSNLPTVNITGDGTGATAVAEVDDGTGTISRIIVTNTGQDYTEATVTISGGDGVGATGRAVISPLLGHGADARLELGGTYKMVKVTFDEDENGKIDDSVTFRRAGIVSEPLSSDTGAIVQVDNANLYQVGETLSQSSTGATGTITHINLSKGYIYLSNVSGTFNETNQVSSQTYNATTPSYADNSAQLPLTDNVIGPNDIELYTGELLYFSTRELITRGPNQEEQIRFVIAF